MVQRYNQVQRHYGPDRLSELHYLGTSPMLYRGVTYGLSDYTDAAACHYYVARLRGTAAYPSALYGGTGYLREHAVRKMQEHIDSLVDAGLCEEVA